MNLGVIGLQLFWVRFLIIKKVSKMEKYKCMLCGYVYDPENGDPDSGIKPGTSFEDIPDDWVCPICGAGKDQFEKGLW